MTNTVYVKKNRVIWIRVDSDGDARDMEVCTPHNNKYIKRWIGSGLNTRTQQICGGGRDRGNTLTWQGETIDQMAKNFARDIRGKFFETEAAANNHIAKEGSRLAARAADRRDIDAYLDD